MAFGVIAVALLLLLGMAELVARWVRPDLKPSSDMQIIPDPFIGWRYLPCQQFRGRTEYGELRRIQINSLGFPDAEHALEATEGVTRLAFLGDSFTAAMHVDYENSFAQVAGRKLQKTVPRTRWEVLNFGVTGFGTLQEHQTWKYYAAPFHPQITVLAFFLGNDVANNLPDYNPTMEQRMTKRSWFYRQLLEPSLLYQQYKLFSRDLRHHWRKNWTRRVRSGEQALPFWKRDYAPIDWQSYLPRPDPAFEQAWKTTEKTLRQLRDEVQSSGSVFQVALLPGMEAMLPADFYRSFPRYPGIEQFQFDLDYPRKRLLKFLAAERIGTVDIQREFERKVPKSDRPRLYFKFDRHFSTLGHRLAGEAIADHLAAER